MSSGSGQALSPQPQVPPLPLKGMAVVELELTNDHEGAFSANLEAPASMGKSSSTARQPFVVLFSFQNPSESPLPEPERVIATQVSRKEAAWVWENRAGGCTCSPPDNFFSSLALCRVYLLFKSREQIPRLGLGSFWQMPLEVAKHWSRDPAEPQPLPSVPLPPWLLQSFPSAFRTPMEREYIIPEKVQPFSR